MSNLKLAMLVLWATFAVACAQTTERPTAQPTPNSAPLAVAAQSEKVETPFSRPRSAASAPQVESSNQDVALSDEGTTSKSTYSAEEVPPTPGIRWSFWPMLVVIGIVTYLISRRKNHASQ